MSPTQEQLIALGAVFEAAFLVDKIAKSGQVSEAPLGCMLGSLLVRDPKNTLDVYGGDDLNEEGIVDRIMALASANPTEDAIDSSSSQTDTGRRSTGRSPGKGLTRSS